MRWGASDSLYIYYSLSQTWPVAPQKTTSPLEVDMNNIQLAIVMANLTVLVSSMATRTPVAITHSMGQVTGVVNGIEAEDASGHNFNIELMNHKPLFVQLHKAACVAPIIVAEKVIKSWVNIS